MELSQHVADEQQLKQELAAMGVEGIPGVEQINQPADD
jgi:DNA-directed RNA polymerase subunit B"